MKHFKSEDVKPFIKQRKTGVANTVKKRVNIVVEGHLMAYTKENVAPQSYGATKVIIM